MKKSVIILIGIIYAASIMLVTFYGLVTENLVYDSVAVESIEIVGDGTVDLSDGMDYYEITTPLSATGTLTYQLECTVNPEDATSKKLVYKVDDSSTSYAEVDETGLVTIFAGTGEGINNIFITVYATDDEENIIAGISDIIWICYPD